MARPRDPNMANTQVAGALAPPFNSMRRGPFADSLNDAASDGDPARSRAPRDALPHMGTMAFWRSATPAR